MNAVNPLPPEMEIARRLQNTMHQLKLELASQGVEVAAVACSFAVTWEAGEISIIPVPERKKRGKQDAE